MPDDNTEQPQADTAPEAPPAQPDESGLPDWARSELRRARDDAAKYRTKAKELEPLASKARELEDASKSETQRLNEQLQAAQAERDRATAEATRVRVALQHGIKADDIDLLGSGSEEDIAKRAARIAALYPPAGQPTPAKPVEALHPGAAPKDEQSPEEQTWQALFGAPTGK